MGKPIEVEGFSGPVYEWFMQKNLYARVRRSGSCVNCGGHAIWIVAWLKIDRTSDGRLIRRWTWRGSYVCVKHLPPFRYIPPGDAVGFDGKWFFYNREETICGTWESGEYCKAPTNFTTGQANDSHLGIWRPGVCSKHLPLSNPTEMRNALRGVQSIHQQLSISSE